MTATLVVAHGWTGSVPRRSRCETFKWPSSSPETNQATTRWLQTVRHEGRPQVRNKWRTSLSLMAHVSPKTFCCLSSDTMLCSVNKRAYISINFYARFLNGSWKFIYLYVNYNSHFYNLSVNMTERLFLANYIYYIYRRIISYIPLLIWNIIINIILFKVWRISNLTCYSFHKNEHIVIKFFFNRRIKSDGV